MTQILRPGLFLVFFVLVICIAPCSAEFTISSVSVDPPGFQFAGTGMTINAVIDVSTGTTGNFIRENRIRLTSDLVDPRWVPVVMLDGQEIPLTAKSGDEIVISGENLSYPASRAVNLIVKQTGKVPSDRVSGENLLVIEELDAKGTVVGSAFIPMPEVPLDTPAAATPTKKPTTVKVFTPIPTDTTPESPVMSGAAVIALAGAVVVVVRRR